MELQDKFTKESSIISALSRRCRICDFLVAEWAFQHNHPLFPHRSIIESNNSWKFFFKGPVETRVDEICWEMRSQV